MIRLAIADDQSLFRAGVSRLISEFQGFQVVAECSSSDEALALVRDHPPDVLLIELTLPGLGGLETTRRVLRLSESCRVVALTRRSDPPFPSQMLKAGAIGFLTKDIDVAELERSLRQVCSGRRYICQDVAQELAYFAYAGTSDNPLDALSQREMQVMLMVVDCRAVSDIASALYLSPKTVNSYRYRIFEKLNIRSDVELVLFALRHGVVDGGSPAFQEEVAGPLARGELAGAGLQARLGPRRQVAKGKDVEDKRRHD
ncbi:MAG: response regulator [OM182 bacterium]|nr:MAG: response regulator [OM182 bacterium]